MSRDSEKTTILVISMGFLMLYIFFSWDWSLYLSLSVGLIGIISKYLSNKIVWVWNYISLTLSKIVPTIILGFIFYLLLFPLSVISKIFTKDPLMLSKKYNSYFITVNKKIEKNDLKNPW